MEPAERQAKVKERNIDSYLPKADTSNPQGLLVNYSPTSFGQSIIGSIVLTGKLRLRYVRQLAHGHVTGK